MKKKEWEKPEMTILVRSNTEEAVLEFCKWAGFNTPQGAWIDCWTAPGVTCNALGES